MAVGGAQCLVEWLKTATCITARHRKENRARVVWATLGPSKVVLVAKDGGGDVGSGRVEVVSRKSARQRQKSDQKHTCPAGGKARGWL